jgi:meiotic recombination protein REC8
MRLRKATNILKAAIGDPMDMNLPNYGDDMPANGASPPAVDQQPSEHSEVVESSSSVAAPMRSKKRSAKPLPRDVVLELKNRQLLSWNSDYLQNMKDAAQPKTKHHIQQQAKKNAEYYVWGAGIGGLGRDQFGARGPLGQFMGDSLFELFTGTSRTPKARPKRSRDSGIDDATQKEAHRKRQKTGEPEGEIGRGRDDEGVFMLGGDEEIELPREAASALDDQQIFSAMPWNISASKRGSSAIPLSGRFNMTSEQGKQGSHTGSRAGSRMVSASPLLRRSTGHPGDYAALQSLDSDAFGGDDFAYAIPTSDPVEAGENVVHPSLRVREALSAEGGNFFTFVAEAITEKHERFHANAEDEMRDLPDVDEAEAVDVEQITFEELLPPPETSKMVASQGFLMLLSLGTKGMLDVQQSTAFDDITLKLTDKAKAMQIVDVEKGEEESSQEHDDAPYMSAVEHLDEEKSSASPAGSEDELAEPDDRHFQEQMAAGHAAAGDEDDHDSLYDSH